MSPFTAQQLPLIPAAVLRQHQVQERSDTRFRAAARLMQAVWRKNQGLAVGLHRTRGGGHRKLGSRLTAADANAGRAFLHPAIAAVARYELAYRERAALIAEERLFGNLLGSQGLAFNLFAPLRLDHERAAVILRRLLPKADITRVLHVAFEHSPGRDEPAFTRDRTAFDVAIIFERADGARGLAAIETKYSEAMHDQSDVDVSHYTDLADAAGLYRGSIVDLLQSSAFGQLTREHLLAQACLMNGIYSETHFIVVAPRLNYAVSRAAARYAAALVPATTWHTSFAFVELEQVVDAYRRTGDTDFAAALTDRYLRFDIVHGLVRDELSRQQSTWSLAPPAPKRRSRVSTRALALSGT